MLNASKVPMQDFIGDFLIRTAEGVEVSECSQSPRDEQDSSDKCLTIIHQRGKATCFSLKEKEKKQEGKPGRQGKHSLHHKRKRRHWLKEPRDYLTSRRPLNETMLTPFCIPSR
eukprot:1140979-Pelagomonas_calceolata.AAC.2